MGSEDVFLTWNDHSSTLVGVFGNLLQNSTLVDCTIAAEGQYLKAHKVVLSACSPYFELLFTQENEKNPIVVLKDIKFEELKSMIDFVYCGKVRIPEDRLEDFIAAAESLQIKGLGGSCKENLSNKKELKTSSVGKREGHALPIRRKHVKRSCPSNSEENTNSLSSVIDVNGESNSCENSSQNEESVDALVSYPSEVTVSKTIASSSVLKHKVSVQERPDGVRTDLSTSSVQHTVTSLTLTERQPLLLSSETVVKSEPDPVAEVFLPETEYFIEPKKEVCLEESPLLDEETNMMMAGGVCQQSRQNSSAFSDFSTLLDTAGTRSYERVQMERHDRSTNGSLQGAAPACPANADPLRGRPPGASAWVGAAAAAAFARGRAFPRSAKVCYAPPARYARSHADHRRFGCQECGRAFLRKQHLQRHQIIHSGERPFSCLECGKAFAQKYSLQEHQRVHTGERPHPCAQCPYASATKSNLLKHVRSMHYDTMEAFQLR